MALMIGCSIRRARRALSAPVSSRRQASGCRATELGLYAALRRVCVSVETRPRCASDRRASMQMDLDEVGREVLVPARRASSSRRVDADDHGCPMRLEARGEPARCADTRSERLGARARDRGSDRRPCRRPAARPSSARARRARRSIARARSCRRRVAGEPEDAGAQRHSLVGVTTCLANGGGRQRFAHHAATADAEVVDEHEAARRREIVRGRSNAIGWRSFSTQSATSLRTTAVRSVTDSSVDASSTRSMCSRCTDTRAVPSLSA